MAPTFIQKGRQKQRDYFYWEFHESNGKQAILWGKWKAIRLSVSKEPDPAIELYDLEKDPQEMNNVAAENSAIVKKMAEMFNREHRYNPDWPLLYAEIKK